MLDPILLYNKSVHLQQEAILRWEVAQEKNSKSHEC